MTKSLPQMSLGDPPAAVKKMPPLSAALQGLHGADEWLILKAPGRVIASGSLTVLLHGSTWPH